MAASYWVDHSYALGLIEGSNSQQTDAIDDLLQFPADHEDFWSTISPNLSTQAVTAHMTDHIATTLYVTGTSENSQLDSYYQFLRNDFDNMAALGHLFVDAMIEQSPERFGNEQE